MQFFLISSRDMRVFQYGSAVAYLHSCSFYFLDVNSLDLKTLYRIGYRANISYLSKYKNGVV